MILLLEKNIRGVSAVMGDRYVKSDKNKKIIFADANNLYGHSRSQTFSYDEIKFDTNVKLEGIINTPDDSDIRYFIEVDLTYPDTTKNSKIYICFC